MPLYLPRSAAALAKVVRRDASRHYALHAVRVLDPNDGTFRLEATDGRRLAVVRGNCDDARPYEALDEAPDGASELLVPAEGWLEAFRMGGNARSRVLPVGLALAEDVATFAVGGQSLTVSPSEGRFPNVAEVLPKGPPWCIAVVDARLLAGLLDVAAAFCPDDSGRVSLLFYAPGKPLGLVTGNGKAFFDGLIMPLT